MTEPLTITLAFKKGALGSPFDKVIDDLTCGPYCHTELALAGPLDAATCYSSRVPAGVGYAQVDISTDEWDRLQFLCSYEQMSYMLGFAEGSTGKPYDYLDLLRALEGHGSDICPLGRFCSQADAEILSNSGHLKLQQTIWTISPNRLFSIASRAEGVVRL